MKVVEKSSVRESKPYKPALLSEHVLLHPQFLYTAMSTPLNEMFSPFLLSDTVQ